MSLIFKELAQRKKYLVVLILSILGIATSELSIPRLIAVLIDGPIVSKDMEGVVKITGIMLLLVLIGICCGILSAYVSSYISTDISRSLRSQLFHKVMNFSMDEINEFSISSLITRTNNDIAQLQVFLNGIFSIALLSPIMCIVGVILAISTDIKLSVVLIIAVPVMVITMLILGKTLMPLSLSIQNKIDNLNLVLREKLTGVRVIRAFGTTKFEENKFDEVNQDYRKTNRKSIRIVNAMLPLLVMILAVTAVAILSIAAFNAHYNGVKYSIGEVVAMITYIFQILSAIIIMTIVIILMPRARACAMRACEVLNSKSSILNNPKNNESIDKRGYLEFKNVSYTYKNSNVPALKNLSFKSAPGETTAIIGGTGMGKSTIINLIPRIYDVTEGEVLVDGINIKDYDIKELRDKIAFVPQKAFLFSGTIDSNLKFADENSTEDDVEEAVRTARSYDFVMKKESGFESHVEQGGANFSGGQKQRLAISRALMKKDAEIFVFDDSFSALDFKTDKELRSALKEKTKNATTIIVAQRINTIMDADRIIVVEKGDIVGIGKHEELLENCEVYKEIALSQLGKDEAYNAK